MEDIWDYSLRIDNVQKSHVKMPQGVKTFVLFAATNVAGVTNCSGELSVEETATSAAAAAPTNGAAAASAFRMKKLGKLCL